MERPSWAPEDIDLERASIARTYDYWLGGFHNFQADRDVAEYTNKVIPHGPSLARNNRSFLRRVVRLLVDGGVNQFLDLGSGIPTVGNVHEIAQARNPQTRIVYVDIDPVAVAHSRAILEGNTGAGVVHADFRKVRDVLDAPEVARLLDLTEPVAVLLLSVMHFIPDEEDPVGVIDEYFDALVPGSHLAISTGSDDDLPPGFQDKLKAMYEEQVARIVYRSKKDVEALAGGLSPVPPGLNWVEDWPEPNCVPELPDAARHSIYGGVWRKT